MTSEQNRPANKSQATPPENDRDQTIRNGWSKLIKSPLAWAIATLVIGLLLYLPTMARDLIWGDPTEYTFVAHILGIAHPPGYALITLLGKLFQSLIPFGDYPWRMHLLSVTMALLAVMLVYGTLLAVARHNRSEQLLKKVGGLNYFVALFGALLVASATDWWQHAIHANPHIITATFLAANLYILTRWWASKERPEKELAGSKPHGRQSERSDRWLYAFAFTAGLGITHHPLTVFSFAAYGVFILWVRPGIWRAWRTWLKMAAAGLLGLSVWLYLPIRSAMSPAFGPEDMNTLSGFLDHVLARGLTESLPFFGLADLFTRATVFWTLLRLQYALPVIFLAGLGLAWLATDGWQRGEGRRQGSGEGGRQFRRRDSLRPLALLYGLALLSNYLFVMNLRAQDIMAYLLGVFLIIGLLAGIGLWGLLVLVERRLRLDKKAILLLASALFLFGPVLQIVRNGPRISLRDQIEARRYVDDVLSWFDGQGEEAILLNDWEHMTPLWYSQYVEETWPDPADVTPHLVSTQLPWLENVFYYLPGYPVYLSGYRPEIVAAGFRLRPRGPFYQVVQPGDASIPPELETVTPVSAGEIELVASQLAERVVTAGDYVPLTLAMRAPAGTDDYYVPVITLGQGEEQLTFEFTTDSHLISPLWQPGEVIIERFDFALPAGLGAGSYDLSLGFRNLSTQADFDLEQPLGELVVNEQAYPISSERLLANFRQQVGLRSASAGKTLLGRRSAIWDEPLQARAGDTIHITLEWLSLASPGESYTVFLHLIDQANRPLVTLDYTPLGGSTPTYLWIPKWLPGQRMLDPYRLELPEDLQPGMYLIEAGLYEMTGKRRLHMADPAGNLVGDRLILGAVQIEE